MLVEGQIGTILVWCHSWKNLYLGIKWIKCRKFRVEIFLKSCLIKNITILCMMVEGIRGHHLITQLYRCCWTSFLTSQICYTADVSRNTNYGHNHNNLLPLFNSLIQALHAYWAKGKVGKSKMVEHSCSNAPAFADVHSCPNKLHFPNVFPLLQMYICAPMCCTFTNVYLCPNVPHFPNVLHFYVYLCHNVI